MPLSCKIYDRTKNILISHFWKARARNPKNPINQQPTTTYEFHKQILIFRVFLLTTSLSALFRSHSLFSSFPPLGTLIVQKNSALCFEKSNYKNWTLSFARYSASRRWLLSSSAAGGKRGFLATGDGKTSEKNIYSFFHPFSTFSHFSNHGGEMMNDE